MLIGHCKGEPINIDLDRLIETRMFLCANSGSGKSWAIRRLLEQTHGHVQQFVIDPEGEYRTLRERYDYVIAGRDGDVPADPRSAALLCRRLLELGTSAVLDIYDLELPKRKLFVKNFLDALVNVDKSLWHNVLVVVDEVQVFAPESGDSIAAQSVINLMTMGRKRGFCGVIASQRISKVSKDAIAEANNLIIGRAALDIDMKRAADTLGFNRDHQALVRTLPAGNFYMFGPAFSNQEVAEVSVGPIVTSHPKAGQRSAPPPPAPAKIQKVLSQLTDLPKEAEQEAANLSEARQQIATLRKELSAKPPTPKSEPDTEALEKARAAGADSVKKILAREIGKYERATVGHLKAGALVFENIGRQLAITVKTFSDAKAAFLEQVEQNPSIPGMEGIIEEAKATRPFHPQRVENKRSEGGPTSPRVERTRPQAENNSNGDLSGVARKILAALAELEACRISEPPRVFVAMLSGYGNVKSAGFVKAISGLSSSDLVSYPSSGTVALTDLGRENVNHPSRPATTDELQNRVFGVLGGIKATTLETLVNAYPAAMERADLAERCGYTNVKSAGFVKAISTLSSLGLVEYPDRGTIKAKAFLFLQ